MQAMANSTNIALELSDTKINNNIQESLTLSQRIQGTTQKEVKCFLDPKT